MTTDTDSTIGFDYGDNPALRRVAALWSEAGIRDRNEYGRIRDMLQGFADALTASDGRRYRVTFSEAAGLARTNLRERLIEVTPAPIGDRTLSTEALWAVLTSYLAHEATHDRYWRSYRKPLDEAFGERTPLRARAHVYDNLLQDVVGERRFERDYPGLRGIFAPMLRYVASKTPGQRMAAARPVNQAICAVRYAEWNDWTGAESERDWWQDWAHRAASKPTPSRWVAAIREAIAHDAAQQQQPEPTPERTPEPGGEPDPDGEQGEDEGEGEGATGSGPGEPGGEDGDDGDDGDESGAGTDSDEDLDDDAGEPTTGATTDEDEDEDADGSGSDESDEDEDEDGDSDGATSTGSADGGSDGSDGSDADEDGEAGDADSGPGAGMGDDGEASTVPADLDLPPTAPVCPDDAEASTERDRSLIEDQANRQTEGEVIERPDRSGWPVSVTTPDGRVVSAVTGAFQRSRTGTTGYERGHRSGMLDDRSLWRIAADGDPRVFARRSAPEPGRYSIFVMLDASPSMRWNDDGSGGPTPIEQARDAATAIAMAARHQPGLRLDMYAWASGPIIHLWRTGEPLQWTSALPQTRAGGGTNDSAALRWATKAIRKGLRPNETPLIFFLSDGEGQRDLAAAVAEARGQGVTVVGVSIGRDLDKADVYGRDWVAWQGSVAAAAPALATIIGRVMNPVVK